MESSGGRKLENRTDFGHSVPHHSIPCPALGLRENVFHALSCAHRIVSWHTQRHPPLPSFHKLEKRQPGTVEGMED